MEHFPDRIDSKFRLVLLAAGRAEQLMRGARPKVEMPSGTKPTRIALEEVRADVIAWDYGYEPEVDPELEGVDGEAEIADLG